MNNIKSVRYLSFVTVWCAFWMFLPLLLVKLYIGGPVPDLGIVAILVITYFAFPKINSWFVRNTPFGRVWSWARANEETP